MAYQQDTRLCTVTPPGGAEMLVERFELQEHLSQPFAMQIDLLSEKANVGFADMVGKPIGVQVKLEGDEERFFHGVILRFSQGSTDKSLTSYRAEVVPWFALLGFASDCRIYQEKSVPEIIKDVFKRRGFSDFEDKLTGSFEPRGYCVQYRESDLNFVSRLMEEEGISYWLRHEKGKHVLVLANSTSGWPVCPGQAKAEYAATVGATRLAGEVEEWRAEKGVFSGKWEVDDWNFEKPTQSLVSPVQSAEFQQLARYDFAIGHDKLDGGKKHATLRMEIEEAAAPRSRGASSCPNFNAGTRFTLEGHGRADFNAQYLLTNVHHTVTQGAGRDGDDGGTYENSFECIPAKIVFRPTLSAEKPFIHGVQTATVVGPGGEEIYTDKYGRVKVQFHWDRVGGRDDKSSCWVRVSQPFAGGSFGGMFIPRIGQEVVISFLEGDPDRPLITGRVYNAGQMPAWELPGNMTQSGIRTYSTKGAGPENFNEIRFEDKKGNELLFMQAEKDRETLVKHDESKKVGNDQALEVASNKSVEVGGNHSEKVGGNQTVRVAKSRSDSVDVDEDRSVGKDRTRSVGGNEKITISGRHDVTVDGERMVTVQKDDGLNVAQDLSVTVDKNYAIAVTKEYNLGAKKVTIEAKDEIVLKTGSASITMKKNGDIQIQGSKLNLKASGDMILKGSKIKQN